MTQPIKASKEFADGSDLEPFDGCHEMMPARETFDGNMPHCPSQAVLTARLATDSVFTCTIKIPLLERSGA